jgi:hypothetical protein
MAKRKKASSRWIKDITVLLLKKLLSVTKPKLYLTLLYLNGSNRTIQQQIFTRIVPFVEELSQPYLRDKDLDLFFDYSCEPKNLKEVEIHLCFNYFHPKYYLLINSLISHYFKIYAELPHTAPFRLQNKKYTFRTYSLEHLYKQDTLDERIIFADDCNYAYFLAHFAACKRFCLDIECFGDSTVVLTKEIKPQALLFRQGYIRLIQVGIEIEGKRYCLLLDLGGWNRNTYNFSRPRSRVNEQGIKEYSANFNTSALTPNEHKFLCVLEAKLLDLNTQVIGTNLKYDLSYLLEHFGFRATNVVDVMLASQIYWSGVGVDKAIPGTDRGERSRISHGLLAIAERLGFEVSKEEQNTDWGFELSNSQLNYAANDVFILFDIWDSLFSKIMGEQLAFSVKAEFKALPVFVEMEVFGTPVNIQQAHRLLDMYKAAQEQVLIPWNKAFPNILFTETQTAFEAVKEQYQLDVEGINKKELKVLEGKYPWISSLLQARTLNISINYIEDILGRTFVNAKGIPSVASTFFQIREGWRSSSRSPNLQNSPKLPDELRKYNLEPVRTIFAPDDAEYDLIIKDASGCHARIATEASQDPVLKEAYNANKDNHLITAIAILASTGEYYTYSEIIEIHAVAKKKVKVGESLTEEESFILEARDRAKTGFYSFLNQAGKVTMQKNFKQYGFEVPIEDCAKLKKALVNTYSTLYNFIMEQVKIANSHSVYFPFYDKQGNSIEHEEYGVIRGLCGGRKFCKKEPNKWSDERMEVPFTDSISFMWLSAEASMLKLSLGIVREKLLFGGKFSYICNFQHDEMDLVTLKEESFEVATLVSKVLSHVMSMFIKSIPVDDSKETAESLICKSLADK